MSSPSQELLSLWQQVPDDQRGPLVAQLLDVTQRWHEFADSPDGALSWLAVQFKRAGLGMPAGLGKDHGRFTPSTSNVS